MPVIGKHTGGLLNTSCKEELPRYFANVNLSVEFYSTIEFCFCDLLEVVQPEI